MMDSGMVDNHIFFTKPKKAYCSKPIRLFKKGLLSQIEYEVKMELVYKFLSELIECRDYPGSRIAHPIKNR